MMELQQLPCSRCVGKGKDGVTQCSAIHNNFLQQIKMVPTSPSVAQDSWMRSGAGSVPSCSEAGQ